MQKLKDFVLGWSYYDIKSMQHDLQGGGKKTLSIVNDILQSYEEKENAVCVVCGNPIFEPDENTYTLIFGHKDLRKRASFCAQDCMEYFFKDLREKRKKQIIKSEI